MSTLMIPSNETLEFIRQHRLEDVRRLALQAGKKPDVDISFALRQIAGWQIARHKLPQWSQHEGIFYPPHLSMEQCSSETTAIYKAKVMGGGHSFADLTGGLGVDCSYLASAFDTAHYVERDEELCTLASHNFHCLGYEHIQVHRAEAEDFLRNMEPVDCLFLDPARRDNHGAKTVAIADCSPDVSMLRPMLLQKARRVMIKLSPMLDITQALRDISGVSEVHIIAIQNECKELLLLLSAETDPAEPIFHCVHFATGCTQHFSFSLSEEQSATCSFTSTPGVYLYEPNAALLKAGVFRLPATRMSLNKLHPNSHLYTSDTLVPDFPGRIFTVESVCTFGKKELKQLTSSLTQANLTTRNFPSSVAELRKRLKLRDGGNTYLFATTLADERKVIIKCKKASIY